uniref:Uncharacterized protein n=1 Tax=Pyrodinium bahamense TaxID=73915 RepID=A0A7S0A127_9DINO|mmetsp:Transcript_18586/g.51198  ORF Transcript_18586/g.51198 Transcript_18586/m.51198 type:complete len:141 (+) Transcript_18586:176-598(+)
MRFAKDAPLLLEFLRGHGSGLHKALDRSIRVTARFVSRIEPAEPVARLFGGTKHQSPDELLLAFPPPAEPVCLAGPHFISEERLGASLHESHELLGALRRGDTQAVREFQSNMVSYMRSINAGMEPKVVPRSMASSGAYG